MTTAEFRGPVRALCSFAHHRDHDMDGFVALLRKYEGEPSVIADSGAFSAFTMGWQVQPADYAAWLRKWDGLFDYALTLDVINDVEASWRSHCDTQQLAQRRLVPVVHYDAPLDVFDHYQAAGHELIAVGGFALPGRAQPGRRYRRMIQVCRWAAGTGAKLHALGIGDFQQMWRLPWWSVDSSSWNIAHRYGDTRVFDPERAAMLVLPRDTHAADQTRAARLLRSRGVDPRELAADFNYHLAAAVSADSYRRAEHWIRARRGLVPPPDDPAVRIVGDANGLRVYLALLANTQDPAILCGATATVSRGGLERRWVPTS